jgi:Mg2+ and Co2+ transporter CorA
METKDYHIIEKFREMVEKRYDYKELKLRFDLPDNITEGIIDEIENYFLTTIYPPAKERKELEEAFRDLANYVKQPRKIWNLFGDMARAIFKFGRHFMSALRAGMDALDSFVGAKNFEASMSEIANKNGIKPPMSDEDFEDTMYQLEREQVERFIKDVRNLFSAMVNTTLLSKTLDILEHVIQTMEHKPNVFPKKEVDGIKLGKALLSKGYDLFSKYDEKTKQDIVDFIYKNELWYVDYVYRKIEEK